MRGDEGPPRGLERYWSVVRGDAPARHVVLRSIPAGVSLDSPTGELWEAHAESMRAFRRALGDGVVPDACAGPSLLDLKAELAERMMRSCAICEWGCGVDRSRGELGRCRCGEPRISSRFLHMHEEPELVPSYTVFFTGCNARCLFCQNWEISQSPFDGHPFDHEEVAEGIDSHHRRGARNVNWVGGDPTPHLPAVLRALRATRSGIANVWNSNMYLSKEGMALLSGTVDLYLSDLKFGNDGCAERCSGLKNYWEVVTRNHLLAAEDAEVLIRHLALPGHLDCCSRPLLRWVAGSMGAGSRVNLMFQYRPEWRARELPGMGRRLSPDEVALLLRTAAEEGLGNLVR